MVVLYTMRGLRWQWTSLLALSGVALSASAWEPDWREKLVPSFEADNKDAPWLAPGAQSFLEVTGALHQLQALSNITGELLSKLPGLPQVTTFNMTMSDGVQIWTRIVNPWPYKSRKPACVVRSPYGSYATQNLALIFLVLNGHATVMQETRGTWNSGGVFDMWRGAGQDARDTFEWVTRQDWSDGEIYSMGASADGIDAITEILAKPKQLHGQWFIWTTASGHHFVYPGGAYRKDLMVGYLSTIDYPTRGASTALVLPATERNELMGPWWYNLTDCADRLHPAMKPGCHYADVRWPTVLSAGWWDLFHHTMLDAWLGLRAVSDASYRDDHVLIVAPLGHNIAGKLNVGVLEAARLRAAEVDSLVVAGLLTSEFWRWSTCADELLPRSCECQGRVRFGFGDRWSEPQLVRGNITCDREHFGDDPAPGVLKECQCQQATGKLRRRIGRVNLFIMGGFGAEVPLGPGNYWTSLDDFPSPPGRSLYLGAGTLHDSPPEEPGSAFYTYDPSDPTPMIGGNNLPRIGSIEFAGPANQLARDNRSDVLVFDSEPLAEALPIVGALSATVFVSSSAPDTDFFVTVSDLYPDGSKCMLVRYGIQRMRWRESDTAKSAPMVAGQVYETSINLRYTAYIFPKGHRIRVSVSSAADPYYVRTSNTGENDMTTQVDPVVARNGVHFSKEHPSRVTLPVVSLGDIPKNPHFTALGPFGATPPEEVFV